MTARTHIMEVAFEVEKERMRQLEEEGFTTEHDDAYTDGQLALAAAAFALWAKTGGANSSGHAPSFWPKDWDLKWWKPVNKRRALVKAAALCFAEIERLDRAAGA